MYTIKQAAARSGVSVQLLRAWERRYGVVTPARTASGYRLYDDAAIARLRGMRRLIGEGWSAGTAAAEIGALDDAAVDELLGRSPLDSRAERAIRLEADGLADAFVDSASALDERGFEAVLDEMFARGSFEQVTGDLVMPALVALGEGWAAGRVDVAGEHAAAGAVQRRLGMAYMAAGLPGGERDLVLVGLPPGGRHDLGALAFATAARRAGISVRYLGADLPVQDWIEGLTRTRAKALVIGAVIASDVGPAEQVARAARAINGEVLICFGGQAAGAVDLANLAPALRLPDDLAEAVSTLGDALRAAGVSR